MFKFNIHNLIGIICAVYFAYSSYTFYQLFYPNQCSKDSCISPSWTSSDDFKISAKVINRDKVVTEIQSVPLNKTKFQEVYHIHPNVIHPIKGPFKIEIALYDKNMNILLVNKVNLIEDKIPLLTSSHEYKDTFNKSIAHPHVLLNLDLAFFFDTFSFDMNEFPREFIPYTTVKKYGQGYKYSPVFFMNSLMNAEEDYVPYLQLKNESYPELKLNLNLKYCSLGNIRLRTTLVELFSNMENMGFKKKDFNEIKQLLLETSFNLLILIVFVSIVHISFDFLSLKSDIQFWRNTEDTSGLAASTLIWNFLSKIIIFLYLMEERSSLLVTIPAFASTIVDLWKLKKFFKIFNITFSRGLERNHKALSEVRTDEIDREFTNKSYLIVPPLAILGLLHCYFYLPYKNLYNWTITALVRGVYAFGFLLMTPQLYMNYRLKSVAHLPWRSLTYKAFNTFIDDFFAFVITMPTTHRIACFRDDIVFIMYLYQRWLYPVDKSRKNSDIATCEVEEPHVKKNE